MSQSAYWPVADFQAAQTLGLNVLFILLLLVTLVLHTLYSIPKLGRIAWARCLYQRLEEPMNMLGKRAPKILLSEQGQELVSLYNGTVGQLVGYEITVYQTWSKMVRFKLWRYIHPFFRNYERRMHLTHFLSKSCFAPLSGLINFHTFLRLTDNFSFSLCPRRF